MNIQTIKHCSEVVFVKIVFSGFERFIYWPVHTHVDIFLFKYIGNYQNVKNTIIKQKPDCLIACDLQSYNALFILNLTIFLFISRKVP